MAQQGFNPLPSGGVYKRCTGGLKHGSNDVPGGSLPEADKRIIYEHAEDQGKTPG